MLAITFLLSGEVFLPESAVVEQGLSIMSSCMLLGLSQGRQANGTGGTGTLFSEPKSGAPKPPPNAF